MLWWLRKCYVAILLSSLLVLGASSASLAAPNSGASTQEFCPLILACDLTLSANPNRRAFGLYTTASEPGTASGTLTVFSGNDRFDVPFNNVRVAGLRERPDAAEPIVAELPRGIEPDVEYVSSLNGEPCPILISSSHMYDETVREQPADDAVFWRRRLDGAVVRAAAAAKTPVIATATHLEPPDCDEPFRTASAIDVPQSAYPLTASAMGESGRTAILVTILPNSQPASVQVYKSSGHRRLDEAALMSAFHTTYKAERFRCQPVGGTYLFTAFFQQ